MRDMAKLENSKNKSSWGGSRDNAGRPKGSQNKATKERKAVEEAFTQRVMEHADDLFNAQYNLATGTAYVYRVDETEDDKGKKKRDHVLVTDPDEIKEVLDETDGSGGVVDENYYYITTRSPSNQAIESLLNRAIGKPQDNVDVTSKGEALKTIEVVKYESNNQSSS